MNIEFKKPETKSFELVVQVKDNNGRPTGKTTSVVSDKGSEINKFWHRHNGYNKKKRKMVEAASTENDIKLAVKAVDSYTNKIRKDRGLED